MNLGSPQTLVRVDISHAPQKALVQQQRLNSRAAGSCLLYKFFRADFQRIGPEGAQLFGQRSCRKVGEPAESPRIRVTKLAIIIEQETSVGMLCAGLF